MSILKNIKREWTYLSFLLPVLSKTNKLDKNPNLTVADLIEEQVDKNPSLIALEYEDKKYTYQQLDQEANKVANWAIDKGCLLYTSPSPRDVEESRMPSSA